MSAAMIYITCENETQAREIGRTLVAERLAACVNILPGMTSLFWWEGEVREANEAVLLAKTRMTMADALTDRVRELHSYDVPCVVVLPILRGNPDFIRWIEEQTQSNS
ncbi:divalent-cation tolerance protein CutA [Desulfolutivibrio sulfoxidireducens]|uniref:divalent-cation tolerance protein CutA n=1 Tax=Desulfolutivibrio sulfoxidireducens TaxID=2773299 RepID=UPI00159E22DF|nr:divalent-cation tolerance protein CutA [Desulfolutivibrio sulfoxidireducens]QLA15834.1 divalent cation tolerance protein CutA [Desulfolutivibrio sulfoxidireducens]QLA20264.1 divalent cation tolerance protein CutA [Desulfolutivibrio sulfoxidireducens]